MTDRDLMQRMYDYLLREPDAKRACDQLEHTLRERLAQYDALDRMVEDAQRLGLYDQQ